MEFVGDVVIETEEGDILKGNRFFWNSEKEMLTSLEPVEEVRFKLLKLKKANYLKG
ncbi:hypothetical protein ES708_17833 [subsurface metagenome]